MLIINYLCFLGKKTLLSKLRTLLRQVQCDMRRVLLSRKDFLKIRKRCIEIYLPDILETINQKMILVKKDKKDLKIRLNGQTHPKSRASFSGRFKPNTSVVFVHDVFTDSKAYACAFVGFVFVQLIE